MNETPDFFSRFDPFEVKQERLKLIDSLTRFVLQGIRPQFGPPRTTELHPSFEEAIRSILFDCLAYQVKLPKSWKSKSGDTYIIFSRAFRDSMHYSGISQVCVPPLDNEKMDAQFIEEYDAVEVSYEQFDTSVQGAYDSAVRNILVTETRIVALSTIIKLVHGQYSQTPRLDEVANEIRQVLWARRNDFMFNVLLFGSLLGGKQQIAAIKKAANSSVYNPNGDVQFSVMHFIQSDGIAPGSYYTEDSNKLQADIVKHYNQLGARDRSKTTKE